MQILESLRRTIWKSMLMMQQEHGYIRSIDVAEQLGVSRSRA